MVDAAEARREAFLARMNKGKQTSSGFGLGFFKPNTDAAFFKCKEGDHDMDIIPYLAGPDDPDTPEGELTYVLEVYNHRDVGGIENQDYICMAKTYKQACPVCEHRQTLIKDGAEDDVIKELRPSRYPRSIYNILCYDDTAEEAKGIQVFHTSHYIMEMYLLKLAESSKRDIEQGHPPYKFFADPEEGWSVKFTRTGVGLNTRYIAHQLAQRTYTIPQETLDMAWQLDQLIHIPEYKEVYQAFWGEELGDAGASAMAQPAAPAASPRGAVQTAAPVAAGGRGAAPAQPTPVEAQAGDYVCPGGGTFGVDTYNLQHCEQCELWEPCVQENTAAQADAEAAQAGDPDVPAPVAAAPAAAAGRAAAPPQPAAPAGRGGGRAPAARGAAPARAPAAPGTRAAPAAAGRGGGRAPAAGRGAAPAGNARGAAPAKRTLR